MRTMFYKTSNFIQHSGKVVDLDKYRRRLALAQRDSLARQPETASWSEGKASAFRPVVLTATREERRRARSFRRAWTLDACASLAVVLMTLLFALRVML